MLTLCLTPKPSEEILKINQILPQLGESDRCCSAKDKYSNNHSRQNYS